MKVLVTYQSKTGFTKKYAEWISQDLSCDLREVSNINAAEIAAYNLVIHGGWVMAGMVKGLDKIRKMSPNKLIVFGVGFTSKEKIEMSKVMEANKLGGIPFFYYEGGINPSKMGLVGRKMVKMMTKETPMYTDHTNKEEIKELVKLAR